MMTMNTLTLLFFLLDVFIGTCFFLAVFYLKDIAISLENLGKTFEKFPVMTVNELARIAKELMYLRSQDR